MNKRLIEHERKYRNTMCSCLYPVLYYECGTIYRCENCGGWRKMGYVYAEDCEEIEKELRFWRATAILFIVISILYLLISEMTINTIKKIGGAE